MGYELHAMGLKEKGSLSREFTFDGIICFLKNKISSSVTLGDSECFWKHLHIYFKH